MKAKPTKKAPRPASSVTLMHRMFVTHAVDAAIGLGLGSAAGRKDEALYRSLERIAALLNLEAEKLGVPGGSRGL